MEATPARPDLSQPQDTVSAADAQAQAYAFRQLVAHLQSRVDVQNIEMMILSGFCRVRSRCSDAFPLTCGQRCRVCARGGRRTA